MAAVGVGFLLLPILVKDPSWQNLAILVLVNASAAAAWNLLGGYTGQVSFGQSIFFGAGAYTTGYLLARHEVLPWFGIAAGMTVALVAGLVIGFPVFRLRRHYFSIATIAMQQLVFTVVVNTKELGSATGLELPIKEPSILNLQFPVRDQSEYVWAALALFGLTSLVIWLYLRGRAGAYSRAIRDDEEVARAMGVPVRRYKLFAISLSAVLTAMAGGYYGMYVLFVDPNIVLSLSQSIAIVLVAVLGGAGTLWGPLVGAAVLSFIQQQTRIHLGGGGSGLDFVIYGALVVAIAVLEPAGLVGLAGRLRRRLSR